MRPRLRAAENREDLLVHGPRGDASMRPRLRAAENGQSTTFGDYCVLLQ